MALYAISTIAYSQDTYLCGRITGFDINNTGIDRPVDLIRMEGFIVLDKSDLVIQTRRKGRDWVQAFKVESIGEPTKGVDNFSYSVWAKDSQNNPTHFRIKSSGDGTWEIEYTADKTKWNYEGVSLKKWLEDTSK